MSAADPNRYAGPAEAALLRDDIAAEEGVLQTVEARRAAVRSALHDAEQRLRAAQEEAESARAILAQIDAREAQAQQNILRARGLLHPVRRLPYDVLSAVFLAWNDEVKFDNERVGARYAVQLVPFLAASVCRRWRSAALDTPMLWTTLELPFDAAEDRPLPWATYVECIVTRSKSLGLAIVVDTAVPQETPITDTFIDALLLVSRRWRTLEVERTSSTSLPDSSAFRRLVSCHDVPILESLKLCMPEGDQPALLVVLPQSAPRLLALSLEFELYDKGFEISDLGCIARSMPNLRKLNLSLPTRILGDPEIITFSRLHSLEIFGLEDTISRSLRCPMLEELEISCIQGSGAARVFAQFVESALSPAYRLRKLVFRACTLRTTIANALEPLRNIEEIIVYSSTVRDGFFQTLSAPTATGEWHVPRLFRFHVLKGDHISWTDRPCDVVALQELVRARETASRSGGSNAPSALTDVKRGEYDIHAQQ
ncbi:hypothetical protein EXIGLDRAFT_829811 [Exidia glandulosa HHB12029]|uniref:Uncharacterized protein n=1 Tax=Exidia glandulosa HHB12029 TaxID=1314781 RepID=A0A165PAV9_EXIGL|nr:hypothetical protein EXIGLDRAFT_829811 [Exidia glandulosa HHB12029]